MALRHHGPGLLLPRQQGFAQGPIDGAVCASYSEASALADLGASSTSKPWRCIVKIWSYIEAHHEEFGCALFVLPAAFLGLVIVGIVSGLSLLLR
jgi:hypothetical protein